VAGRTEAETVTAAAISAAAARAAALPVAVVCAAAVPVGVLALKSAEMVEVLVLVLARGGALGRVRNFKAGDLSW
jgi:hypothetical protein